MKILFICEKFCITEKVKEILEDILTTVEVINVTNCQKVLKELKSSNQYDLIFFETLDLPSNLAKASDRIEKYNTLLFIRKEIDTFKNYIGKIIIWNNSKKTTEKISDMNLDQLELHLIRKPICEEALTKELKNILNIK